MIRNTSLVEVKRGDRTYRLYLENDSPLGECFDVLSEMRSLVYERIKQVEEEQSKKPVEAPSEEAKPE